MKNKGRSTTVSGINGRARHQLTDVRPLRSVFLISKIIFTGNPGTLLGKAQTYNFPFFSCSLDLEIVYKMAPGNSGFTPPKAIMLGEIFCP